MADRIVPIWSEEAMAIWERIIQNSTDADQGDYDNANSDSEKVGVKEARACQTSA